MAGIATGRRPAAATRHAHDDVPLARYAERMGRAGPLVAAGALAGVVVGAAAVVLEEPVFVASTAVLVADVPVTLPDAVTPGPRRFTMDTEAARVGSTPVLTAVTRVTRQEEVEQRLTVTAVPTTKVLVVSYRSDDPAVAVRGADAAATAYLATRQAALTSRRETRVETIQQGLTTLRDRLDQLSSVAAGSLDTSERARRDALALQVRSRQDEARRAAVAATWPGEVVRAAALDGAGGRSNVTVPPVSGLLVGALLGAVLARLRSSRMLSRADLSSAAPGAVAEIFRVGRGRDVAALTKTLTKQGTAGPRVVSVLPTARGEHAGAVADDLVVALRRAGRGPDVRRSRLEPMSDRAAAARLQRLQDAGGGITVLEAPSTATSTGFTAAVSTDAVVLAVPRGSSVRDFLATRRQLVGAGASLTGVVLIDERPRTWWRALPSAFRPQTPGTTGATTPTTQDDT